jgi:hypothetical protein
VLFPSPWDALCPHFHWVSCWIPGHFVGFILNLPSLCVTGYSQPFADVCLFFTSWASFLPLWTTFFSCVNGTHNTSPVLVLGKLKENTCDCLWGSDQVGVLNKCSFSFCGSFLPDPHPSYPVPWPVDSFKAKNAYLWSPVLSTALSSDGYLHVCCGRHKTWLLIPKEPSV